MSNAYMITNRQMSSQDLTGRPDLRNTRYFFSTGNGDELRDLNNWEQLSPQNFRDAVAAEASVFESIPEEDNEEQKHITLFIHGYNNNWREAVTRYSKLRSSLFSGTNGIGVPIFFTWPSDGSVAGYLSDREDARAAAPQVADVFVFLHDHLVTMQRAAAVNNTRNGSAEGKNQTTLCKAKMSVIAHSMGNYVMQNALSIASQKLNNPQLITLIHQLVMVAADVDNDIFQKDKPNNSDGALMANLCYRISSLFSGLDQVLGASAGLKHFGTRRLGRSGLANATNVWDNVCQFDMSSLIEGAKNSHSAIFDTPEAMNLLRDVIRGVDRGVVASRYKVRT